MYCPSKPTKFGIKEYLLCDYSGYTLAHRIHSPGRGIKEDGHASLSTVSMTHAHAVVSELVTGRVRKGSILLMDNFYNSLELLEELTIKGIGVIGTVRYQIQ